MRAGQWLVLNEDGSYLVTPDRFMDVADVHRMYPPLGWKVIGKLEMSDTPRTDAEHDAIYAETGVGGLVNVEFARQLERELNEALQYKRRYLEADHD